MTFVVLAGQSNALGFGMSGETLPAEAWVPDPLTFIWNDPAQAFEVMQPGINTGTAANPQAWGPEVGLARAFRQDHPLEALYIVKSVKGSTGLEADPDRLDWSPHSEGELFDLTASKVAAARAALGGAEVDAVFLAQGEQDGCFATWAEDYAANMGEWLQQIREQWMADPEGRVGFVQVADSTPFADMVRAAQLEADAADPWADSFDPFGYEMQADGLHYTASGLMEMGAGFEALLDDWASEAATAASAFDAGGWGLPDWLQVDLIGSFQFWF